MKIPEHSLHHTTFDVWRSPGRFTKNPDLVRLPSGRMLLVYADTDRHWASDYVILTLLASDDGGRSWSRQAEVARADLQAGEERLVTPAPEPARRRPPGDPVRPRRRRPLPPRSAARQPGLVEPRRRPHLGAGAGDRDHGLRAGSDAGAGQRGSWRCCPHLMRPDSQEFAEILSLSDDGGKTWRQAAEVAHDGYHRFCEGALVFLDGGPDGGPGAGAELACVLRENHSAGIPSFVAFSNDHGATWSPPQMCPFALHRPYAKRLADGRVLVTGRHVNGGLGHLRLVRRPARGGGHLPGRRAAAQVRRRAARGCPAHRQPSPTTSVVSACCRRKEAAARSCSRRR